ncbi:hypothetical protein Holit_00404 [Hollandina sp. SP2]
MRLKNAAKFSLAGIMAFLFLNVFCLVYYKLPVHITTKTGVTDYMWEKYAYYSKMTEGFGYGKMNNEGFNNLQDYNAQPIDILVIGSSQMEGTNVPQNKTTTALLNEYFNGLKYVYNIGTSGHNFPHIVNNIETAVQYYKPNEYIVIEIGSTQFNIQDLEASINGTLKRIPSFNNKNMFFLQKMPYLRLIYFQYKNFTGNGEEDEPKQNDIAFDKENYSIVLDAAIKKLHRISIEQDIKITIFYHPHFILDEKGSIYDNTDYEYLAIFKKICFNNDIAFINMEDYFIEEYNSNHILPHGFSNTAVGAGHLNKNGHRLIANELFRQINIMEKDGSI